MKKYRPHIFLVFSFLALSVSVFCQRLPIGGDSTGGFAGGGAGSTGTSQSNKLVRDTSDIFYFNSADPNTIYPFSDSLLDNFHQYDPARLGLLDYANLGNTGSAARPLFFQPAWRRGLDIGFHQFDLYKMGADEVKFYKITQAHTYARYTQGQTQGDNQFNVRFSRNFSNGLNFSIEQQLISNTGAYDAQKARDSDVAIGFWYHNINGRYDGYLTFVSNSSRMQNNGGSKGNLSENGFLPAYQVDVNIRTSQTRHASNEFAYTHYLRLNSGLTKEQKADLKKQKEAEKERKKQLESMPDSLRKPDIAPSDIGNKPPVSGLPKLSGPPGQRPSGPPSFALSPTVNPKRAFTLYHQVSWKRADYKFYDTAPDSAFYDTFFVDDRGLRNYLEHNRLQNIFKLQTFKLRQEKGKTIEGDLFEVGLVHALNFVNLEPVDTQALHDVFLTARLNFAPNERISAKTYAHLGVGNNAGDFRLSGELFISLKKAGELHLQAVNQLYAPSLMASRFYVFQKELWKNDFNKTLETSLSGTYSLPEFHFSMTGQYHLISDLIYFDNKSLPRQSGAFSVFQFMVRKDFHLGVLHLENWAGLQQTTSDILRLPNVYSKHSLYLEGKIFKKVMLTRLGVDARLTGSYDPAGYHPLTGQFYLQDAQPLPFTPLLDAFLSFKVKTFRFFFKIENLLSFPYQRYYYQTADYPLPFGMGNGGLRFGVAWRLVD